MEQLRDVSNILWRERNLLELLAFKLDSERLLARAGRTRWLGAPTTRSRWCSVS